MKRIFILFSLLILSILFLSSCARRFSPMYYYNRNANSLNSENDNTINKPTPDKPEEIPADEDPFKVDSDYNKPNYGGYDASKFDTWLFKASFRDDKLPVYNFFDDTSRMWIQGGLDWNNIEAKYYKAKDKENYASGYGITEMSIYKYDSENPLYDSIGYLPGRMDRFRFYSVKGKAVIVDLKQYLIAVDTYSKFVFAFGAITETETALNGDLVPTKFEAIEYHADKKDFYEYDPIGYVSSTGEVIFYQHYETEFVANPTGYYPKQHGYDNYAEHNKFKPGKSPYVALDNNTEASPEDKAKFESAIKDFIDKPYKWRDYSGYQKASTGEKDQIDLEAWKQSGYAGKSLILYTYTLTDNAQTLTIKQEKFNNNTSSTKTYKLSIINTANKATYTNTANNSESISLTIVKNDSGNNTISVSGTVLDENFQDNGPIFVDRAKNTKFVNGAPFNLSVFSTFVDTGATHAEISELTFEYNEDGTEFTMSYYHKPIYGLIPGKKEHRTQKFKLARFDSVAANTWTAKYECTTTTGSLGNYVRVVFRNGNDTSNPGPNEIGTVMRMSMTLHPVEGVWNIGPVTVPDDPTSNLGLDLVGSRTNP